MRLKLISCEVLFRELSFLVSQSPHTVDAEFFPKGLHDLESGEMQRRLQEIIDRSSDKEYDAIILGYALCNNGTRGLKARKQPMIIPKAHDCITLFMGDRSRYTDYFNNNPGVYFHTTGWMERNKIDDDLKAFSIQAKMGMDHKYDDLVEQFGEDNAQYVWETLYDTKKHYSQFTFIEMGVEPDDSFKKNSKQLADDQDWGHEVISGDLKILRDLVNGNWDEKTFLVIEPGQEIAQSFDEDVIKCKSCPVSH